MRIKSLQINGFKSFVDKTSFAFQPGITAIVGPNGCGKSNVVDAIRWAMGEQAPRRLRGKGMEDVIFAGSDARAPVGLAEVILTFDNADGVAPPEYAEYAEIQVSRRLYRDGESEYGINKTPVRLRDVLDFFRDTGIGTKGYTIVEQGRIAEIVSAKPEERRSLIEEAAGISKYKARRVEAERKLEATEQNLVRVRDVLAEIRRQISSIERQAKKAARYKRLREIQRVLELSLASEERAGLTAELEAAGARLTALRDAAAAAEARLAEREAALEGRRLELAERERLVVEGNELLFQLRSRIKELESQIGYERRERASLAEVNTARALEREQLLEQLRQAEAQEAELALELSVLEAALADEGAATARAEAEARAAEEALRQLERERESDSHALVEVLTRVARSEDRLAALADRATEIDRRLRHADEAHRGAADRGGAGVGRGARPRGGPAQPAGRARSPDGPAARRAREARARDRRVAPGRRGAARPPRAARDAARPARLPARAARAPRGHQRGGALPDGAAGGLAPRARAGGTRARGLRGRAGRGARGRGAARREGRGPGQRDARPAPSRRSRSCAAPERAAACWCSTAAPRPSRRASCRSAPRCSPPCARAPASRRWRRPSSAA